MEIISYFREKLNIDLKLFYSTVKRENLHYEVLKFDNEEEKKAKLIEMKFLIERKINLVLYLQEQERKLKIYLNLLIKHSEKKFHYSTMVILKQMKREEFRTGLWQNERKE